MQSDGEKKQRLHMLEEWKLFSLLRNMIIYIEKC